MAARPITIRLLVYEGWVGSVEAPDLEPTGTVILTAMAESTEDGWVLTWSDAEGTAVVARGVSRHAAEIALLAQVFGEGAT